MAPRDRATTYQRWMRQEGLPVVTGYGVTDVEQIELAPWKRVGGKGAFIHLEGMEGLTGMYVGEIPPGESLNPEKHLYDEQIYILRGRGATEVWHGESAQGAGQGHVFEWQTGSFFAPPLNTWHRLVNGSGTDPVKYLVSTSAPLVMDLFHNVDFVFGDSFRFADRYDGSPDYFTVGGRAQADVTMIWHTNFIPDVPGAALDLHEKGGPGAHTTGVELAGNSLIAHIAEWPVGVYLKGHHHGGGAILLMVRGTGYSLMWPHKLGLQPFAAGYANRVVRVDWQPGSVLSPPTGWLHQHFNTGHEPARHLAMRYGNITHPAEFHEALSGEGDRVSVRLGGNQIEYEDEDPEISQVFKRELARTGAPYLMQELGVAARR